MNLQTINRKDPDFHISDFMSEKTHLCVFYIGTDEETFNHFMSHFDFGYKNPTLTDATDFLRQLYLDNNKLPDFIFADVPLDEIELSKFSLSQKDNILLRNLPILYNEKYLDDSQILRLNKLELIDDAISVNSGKVNYFSKVMLLKQSKLYNQLVITPQNKSQRDSLKLTCSSLVKRVLDIAISLTALTILSPVFLFIIIAIKIESRGSVFYISPRAGRGFKVFQFYKFRSMINNADKDIHKLSHCNQYEIGLDGPKFFKIDNDPRITRFGKFLRNTSADELPQLINVLKGDMSLVGNRPLPIYEAVTLTTNDFVERFNAPAGITGLWQVNKRGKSNMSVEERINLDIAYSKKSNVLYDLKILAKTPVAIFQKSSV